MIELRQSTAGQEIPLGHFLDSTDGNTEETGLTIANTDIKLWKFGATTLANKNSGGGTHISNGVYYCVLDATDTNTLGGLIVFVHVAGALAVRVECAVLPANVWDSKYSTDKQQVDVVQWLGVAPLALSSQRVQTYVGAMAASVVSASAFAQAAADKVWGTAARALTDKAGFALSTAGIKAIWDQATSALTTVGSIGKLLVDNINATISSRSSHAASAIWDVATRALTDKAGFSLSTAGIKAIWDQATSALTTVGSIGKLLVDNINATISSRSSHAASAIWSVGTRVLTANTNLNDPTAAAIADAVWNELVTGHDGAGKAGKQLWTQIDAIKAKTDLLPSGVEKGVEWPTAFLMVDATDFATPETGKTVTVQISKDLGAFANCDNTPATEISAGLYGITLTATEMNADLIILKGTADGCAQRILLVVTS